MIDASATKSTSAASVPVAVVSISPVVLPAQPERGADLQFRISVPVTGTRLPVLLFAHGFGSSQDGYAPLVDYWASHGFAVVQPTFLDSRTLNVAPEDPRTARIWEFRVEDMKAVLDHLPRVERSYDVLRGRLDHDRVVAVGHSFGGHTVGMLLGARVLGPDGRPGDDLSDYRVKLGVLLSTTGSDGKDLSPFAKEHFPFMSGSFDQMTTRCLVVAGDKDKSPLTTRGPDWFTDAYTRSPGADALVTLFGGEHLLGGISGDRVTETTDENPLRVEAVQRMTWAYMRSGLDPEDSAWSEAASWLHRGPVAQGKVETTEAVVRVT